MAIPIRVHGDDASQTATSSFLAISFAPVVVTGDTSAFFKRFLLGVLTLKDLAPDTMSAADSWCEPFVQSFWALAEGAHPPGLSERFTAGDSCFSLYTQYIQAAKLYRYMRAALIS